MSATSPRRPAPVLTAENTFFWDAARAGRLVAQRCSASGELRHPPRPMCPHCGSLEWEEAELSGRGTVYSYSLLHHPQNPQFDYPVIAALVDLEEGIRLVSNLVDIDPADVAIGLAVEVRFEPTVDGGALPVFAPVASAASTGAEVTA